MSTPEENRGQPARMEFAAGGLVGTTDVAKPRMAVVPWVRFRDGTLPRQPLGEERSRQGQTSTHESSHCGGNPILFRHS